MLNNILVQYKLHYITVPIKVMMGTHYNINLKLLTFIEFQTL